MANAEDFSYVFDFGGSEFFANVKSAQEGVAVDITVCLAAQALKIGRDRFKAKGTLKDGRFWIAFRDDFGSEKLDIDYAELVKEIDRCS